MHTYSNDKGEVNCISSSGSHTLLINYCYRSLRATTSRKLNIFIHVQPLFVTTVSVGKRSNFDTPSKKMVSWH